MIRNLLVTFETTNRDEKVEQFAIRFTDYTAAFKYGSKNKYAIINKEILLGEELDQQLIKEEGRHKSIIKIHKIDNIQIMEFKHNEDASEVYFKPFIDYEEIGCYSYDNLKDALLGAITGERLETNEARYAFKFIKKMIEK